MVRAQRLVWSVVLFIVMIGCHSTPEDARKELVAVGIAYTPENFLDRINTGDTKAVDLFLRAGMDPNTQSRAKIPAVFYATVNACNKLNQEKRQHAIEILIALLTHGVDLAATSVTISQTLTIYHDDWTPLLLLAACGCTEGVSLLLDHGAPLESKDRSGLTSLIIAAGHGNVDTVRELLARKANIEAQGGPGNGQTALIAAALNGHKNVVLLLLQHGADVTKRDWAQRAASECALPRYPEISEILKQAEAG